MTAGGGKRIARCGCGALTATAIGDPLAIYGCSCLDCQRKTGSAFSYAALFRSDAVTITGERKSWRRNGDSGRWIDSLFCPTCGISVGFHSEGMPGLTGILVGTFSDPDFLPPERLYWASRRHNWLALPAGLPLLDTQDG